MSVLDKFMDMMRLNDDDYDDEYYDDELVDDDYVEDEKPRGGLFGRRKRDYDDFEEPEEDIPAPAPRPAARPERKPAPVAREPRRPSNVSSMRSSHNNMEVCVVKPTALDDSREIINTLLSGRTVILNLEGLDLEISQRIIDFTSGATYAIDGHLQKISSYIFLITPTNVEISGDLQDLLGGGNALNTSQVSRF